MHRFEASTLLLAATLCAAYRPALGEIAKTGSGFAVTESGLVLTNNHVISECSAVMVRDLARGAVEAQVIARDPKNDLALLATGVASPSFAAFRRSAIPPGEAVIAVGFPLRGVLANEASVSFGIVSALAGLGNDVTQMQISAPVQPGNSGGPLLDLRGAVVGVVVSKLDALRIAKVTGDVPQNVNFAVKGELVQLLMVSAGVQPTYAFDRRGTESGAETAARARRFTRLIECLISPKADQHRSPKESKQRQWGDSAWCEVRADGGLACYHSQRADCEAVVARTGERCVMRP